MRAIFVKNGWEKAMLGKAKRPSTMSMDDFEDMDIKVLTLIQLSLSNEVLREVAKEDFEDMDIKALTLIHLSLSNNQVSDKPVVVEEQASWS
jgi:hypothetical protein